jgi:hypothetical protein
VISVWKDANQRSYRDVDHPEVRQLGAVDRRALVAVTTAEYVCPVRIEPLRLSSSGS